MRRSHGHPSQRLTQLTMLIAGVDDSAFLAAVADWIVVCATGADLLDLVAAQTDCGLTWPALPHSQGRVYPQGRAAVDPAVARTDDSRIPF